MPDRIKLSRPVITEGKYDKIKLSSILDATIVTTDGFGVFSDGQKKEYIRKLAEKNGIFLLTDSDGAGLVIRNEIHSILPPDKITDLYIPQISGKEKRKKSPSKEGLLGVEGVDADLLRSVFLPFAEDATGRAGGQKEDLEKKTVSRTEFYSLGFLGGEGSKKKREDLCANLGLPKNLSSSALLKAINELGLVDEFEKYIK